MPESKGRRAGPSAASRGLGVFLTAQSPSLVAVARLSVAGLGVVSAPLVARAIGPEGKGQTAAAIALFIIVPIVIGFGSPMEVRRLVAIGDSEPVLRTARLAVLLAFIPASLVAWLCSLTVFASFPGPARSMAVVGVALTPLTLNWMFDEGLLLVQERYGGVFAIQVAQPLIYVVILVALILLGEASTATVIGASIVGSISAAVLGLALTRVSPFGRHYSLWALVRGAARFGGGAVSDIGIRRLDQVIALPVLGAYQAGIYSVASTVASVPLALGHALGAPIFNSVAQTEKEERREVQAKGARAGLVLGALSYPVMAVLSFLLVPLLFGEQFRAAVPVILIYLIGSIAMVANLVCMLSLAASNRGVSMTVSQVVALGLNMLLLVLLGRPFGAVGAAAASTLAYVGLLLLFLASLRLRPSRVVPHPTDIGEAVGLLRRSR